MTNSDSDKSKVTGLLFVLLLGPLGLFYITKKSAIISTVIMTVCIILFSNYISLMLDGNMTTQEILRNYWFYLGGGIGATITYILTIIIYVKNFNTWDAEKQRREKLEVGDKAKCSFCQEDMEAADARCPHCGEAMNLVVNIDWDKVFDYLSGKDNLTPRERHATKKRIRNVVRYTSLFGIICFFMPFASVSCVSVRLANYSGYELAQGAKIPKQYQKDFDGDKKIGSNRAIVGAWIAIGIATLISFLTPKKPTKYLNTSSIFHALTLVGLAVFYWDADRIASALRMYLELRIGFWLIAILALINIALIRRTLYIETRNSSLVPQ